MGKSFLKDHKRYKSKLYAPMNHLLQDKNWNVQFIEASHEKAVVPEVLWLAYIQEKFGVNTALNVIDKFVEVANNISGQDFIINGYVSSLCRLNKDQSNQLFYELDKVGIIDIFTESLYNLKVLFPTFPASFLIKENDFYKVGSLEQLKNIVRKLNNRISLDTTFVLSNLMYPMIKIGRITFGPNYEFLHPKELFLNPDSEKSIRIAAEIRMNTKTIDQEIITYDKFNWQNEFWKQCLYLDPCKITTLLYE